MPSAINLPTYEQVESVKNAIENLEANNQPDTSLTDLQTVASKQAEILEAVKDVQFKAENIGGRSGELMVTTGGHTGATSPLANIPSTIGRNVFNYWSFFSPDKAISSNPPLQVYGRDEFYPAIESFPSGNGVYGRVFYPDGIVIFTYNMYTTNEIVVWIYKINKFRDKSKPLYEKIKEFTIPKLANPNIGIVSYYRKGNKIALLSYSTPYLNSNISTASFRKAGAPNVHIYDVTTNEVNQGFYQENWYGDYFYASNGTFYNVDDGYVNITQSLISTDAVLLRYIWAKSFVYFDAVNNRVTVTGESAISIDTTPPPGFLLDSSAKISSTRDDILAVHSVDTTNQEVVFTDSFGKRSLKMGEISVTLEQVRLTNGAYKVVEKPNLFFGNRYLFYSVGAENTFYFYEFFPYKNEYMYRGSIKTVLPLHSVIEAYDKTTDHFGFYVRFRTLSGTAYTNRELVYMDLTEELKTLLGVK